MTVEYTINHQIISTTMNHSRKPRILVLRSVPAVLKFRNSVLDLGCNFPEIGIRNLCNGISSKLFYAELFFKHLRKQTNIPIPSSQLTDTVISKCSVATSVCCTLLLLHWCLSPTSNFSLARQMIPRRRSNKCRQQALLLYYWNLYWEGQRTS